MFCEVEPLIFSLSGFLVPSLPRPALILRQGRPVPWGSCTSQPHFLGPTPSQCLLHVFAQALPLHWGLYHYAGQVAIALPTPYQKVASTWTGILSFWFTSMSPGPRTMLHTQELSCSTIHLLNKRLGRECSPRAALEVAPGAPRVEGTGEALEPWSWLGKTTMPCASAASALQGFLFQTLPCILTTERGTSRWVQNPLEHQSTDFHTFSAEDSFC